MGKTQAFLRTDNVEFYSIDFLKKAISRENIESFEENRTGAGHQLNKHEVIKNIPPILLLTVNETSHK